MVDLIEHELDQFPQPEEARGPGARLPCDEAGGVGSGPGHAVWGLKQAAVWRLRPSAAEQRLARECPY